MRARMKRWARDLEYAKNRYDHIEEELKNNKDVMNPTGIKLYLLGMIESERKGRIWKELFNHYFKTK